MHQNSPRNPISSKDNSHVKYLRSLTEPKYRKKEQVFLIEGVKVVEEALRDDLGVRKVIATPTLTQHHGKGILKLAESKGIEVLWISERLLDALAESKTPQPVMAVTAMPRHSEASLIADEAGLIVIAHQLQDPGNLGTIVRTAEAAGASGIALAAHTVDPFNAKTIRASMGSVLRVPLVAVEDLPAFIGRCKEKGFQTAATVLTGDRTLYDLDLTKPTAVFFGQEGAGLPQDIIDDIDINVRIPMAGTIESLNVAVSAAVFLYEALRQRLRV